MNIIFCERADYLSRKIVSNGSLTGYFSIIQEENRNVKTNLHVFLFD